MSSPTSIESSVWRLSKNFRLNADVSDDTDVILGFAAITRSPLGRRRLVEPRFGQ